VAATDGVALFFPEKTDDLLLVIAALWKVMTVFSCRLLATPIFPHRLFSVLSKFRHKKNNSIRVSPSVWYHPGRSALLSPPSDATAANTKNKDYFVVNCVCYSSTFHVYLII